MPYRASPRPEQLSGRVRIRGPFGRLEINRVPRTRSSRTRGGKRSLRASEPGHSFRRRRRYVRCVDRRVGRGEAPKARPRLLSRKFRNEKPSSGLPQAAAFPVFNSVRHAEAPDARPGLHSCQRERQVSGRRLPSLDGGILECGLDVFRKRNCSALYQKPNIAVISLVSIHGGQYG